MMRPIELLYQLQQTEIRLGEIATILATLDAGERLEASINEAEKQLEKGRESLREARRELLDRELELNDIEAKIRKFEDLLASGSIRSGREVEHVQHELDELKRRKDIMEDRMLELMLRVEEGEKRLRELEEMLKQNREKLNEMRVKATALRQRLKQESEKLMQRREQLREDLDESLLERYDRMKARLGGIAVSKVDGNLCGACRVTLMTGILRSLRDPDALLTCENCGRFLFGG